MRYDILETKKDGTKFLSKDMKAASERLQKLSNSYDHKQAKLVLEVRNQGKLRS